MADATVSTHGATHLPLVEEHDAPPEVQRLYTTYRERFGRPTVPGILKCFATHPPLLEHMIGIAQTMLFAEGTLSRKEKEMLATFISADNACAYCADSHGSFFLAEGGSTERLDALLHCNATAKTFNAKEQAMLRFVSMVNRGAADVSSAEVRTLEDAGWSTPQIAEAIHIAALFAAFNRVVNAFGLPSQQVLASTVADRQRR